jgi:hypothetical protein
MSLPTALDSVGFGNLLQLPLASGLGLAHPNLSAFPPSSGFW